MIKDDINYQLIECADQIMEMHGRLRAYGDKEKPTRSDVDKIKHTTNIIRVLNDNLGPVDLTKEG